jgi:hypothetical protein
MDALCSEPTVEEKGRKTRPNVVLMEVLAGLTKTPTELGQNTDSKTLKSKCCSCIYLFRVGHESSPCTSCTEQSSCLPGCTHSCKSCNKSCVERHRSTQNKPLFWICQSTSCTCHSDLKTEHLIYIQEPRKAWGISRYSVFRGNTHGT